MKSNENVKESLLLKPEEIKLSETIHKICMDK